MSLLKVEIKLTGENNSVDFQAELNAQPPVPCMDYAPYEPMPEPEYVPTSAGSIPLYSQEEIDTMIDEVVQVHKDMEKLSEDIQELKTKFRSIRDIKAPLFKIDLNLFKKPATKRCTPRRNPKKRQ